MTLPSLSASLVCTCTYYVTMCMYIRISQSGVCMYVLCVYVCTNQPVWCVHVRTMCVRMYECAYVCAYVCSTFNGTYVFITIELQY